MDPTQVLLEVLERIAASEEHTNASPVEGCPAVGCRLRRAIATYRSSTAEQAARVRLRDDGTPRTETDMLREAEELLTAWWNGCDGTGYGPLPGVLEDTKALVSRLRAHLEASGTAPHSTAACQLPSKDCPVCAAPPSVLEPPRELADNGGPEARYDSKVHRENPCVECGGAPLPWCPVCEKTHPCPKCGRGGKAEPSQGTCETCGRCKNCGQLGGHGSPGCPTGALP